MIVPCLGKQKPLSMTFPGRGHTVYVFDVPFWYYSFVVFFFFFFFKLSTHRLIKSLFLLYLLSFVYSVLLY